MAMPTSKFPTITVFFIFFFTNPFVCLCRCPLQESEALLSLNFTSPATFYGTPWTNETDCCKWDGITCDQDERHVAGISLRSYMDYNGIRGGVISDSLCKLPFLTQIDIWNIGTTGTLPSCLGDLHFLQSLTIDYNRLSGEIPLSICMLTNLTLLSLRGNQLSGSLPDCLNNISALRHLYISENRLSGQIPFAWGNLPFLEVLDVSFNQLSGTLPLSFAGLTSLTELCAHGNRLNESNPSWALPSSIGTLYLSLNHEITISEGFFHNLANLRNFSLSNCTLNISTSWIPNFQLYQLELVSCLMDSQIPQWISTQFSLQSLTLANNGLAGEIPSWLWAIAASLSELNISRNHLHGPLFSNGPNSDIQILDVSNNAFSGHIPSVWPIMEIRHAFIPLPYVFPIILMFNDNLFTGNIPPSLCNSSVPIGKLNLENNKLGGMIPWCLMDDRSPVYDLNLGGNSLEGRMPQGLTVSSGIKCLVIRNNQLSGTFLPSFTNDTDLQVLDIGHNKFTGHLPKSIRNISSLQVLVMKDNQFSGNILSEIGELKQLQILDLSSNNLSGSIPHNIVFLPAMAVAREDGYVLQSELAYGRGGIMIYTPGLDMTPKGTELHYPYILSTLTSIDLSSNQLNGDVPLDFGKLKGLMFLNLSMNNLSGIIPHSLGDMSRLESLDLSSNKLSGNIPSELQSLSSLAYLNLSNNNLSGSIPQGGQMITFENTSYSGNPNLQGCPLPKNCNWPKFAPPPPVKGAKDKDDEESENIPWYGIGLGWSYGAGFFSILVLLISVRESCRMKYFEGVDNILKFLFPSIRNRTL
ncbi:receptor-like protein 7 [Cryptomeria japonica]|uniref:receptor-like protein 7 n=1 Tax=Cryptomeria japonica TaxID=3369 RepID=UPI0027DA3F6E|nr:receptor-like protein 7 [Cryptomeria japonica]